MASLDPQERQNLVNAIKIAHLIVGMGLVIAAVLSGTVLFAIAGVILATAGWFGLCPMARVLARARK
jgi:hypothetical protein